LLELIIFIFIEPKDILNLIVCLFNYSTSRKNFFFGQPKTEILIAFSGASGENLSLIPLNAAVFPKLGQICSQLLNYFLGFNWSYS